MGNLTQFSLCQNTSTSCRKKILTNVNRSNVYKQFNIYEIKWEKSLTNNTNIYCSVNLLAISKICIF